MKLARYIGCDSSQVKWGDNDDPRTILEEGSVYAVKSEEVHAWHTKIELEAFPGKKFNSVCFEEAA